MKKYISSFVIIVILSVIVQQSIPNKKKDDKFQCNSNIKNEKTNNLKELPRYYSFFI